MFSIARLYFRGGLVANEVGVLEGTTSTNELAYGESNRAPAKHVALWEEEQSRSSSICRANSYDKRIATRECSYGRMGLVWVVVWHEAKADVRRYYCFVQYEGIERIITQAKLVIIAKITGIWQTLLLFPIILLTVEQALHT